MLDKIKRLANKGKILNFFIIILFRLSAFLISFLYIFFRMFPLQNKVVCINMKGKRYGDNPKYITQALLHLGYSGEIVWLFTDPSKISVPSGVRKRKYNIIREIYETATAKVWVDSNLKWYGTRKRKNQVYIQTWHGSYGLKKIQADLRGKLSYFDEVIGRHNTRIIDLFLSNSDMTTEIYRRAFNFDGDIIQQGSPRNDIFFSNYEEYKLKVCSYYGIKEKKILLYAPTYRSHFSTEAFSIDFSRLLVNLSKRFGDEWVILVRLHPQNMIEADLYIDYTSNIINATDYSDMQELLCAADIIVSDYSSCMFDFVTVYKPCFIYATDLETYKHDRDFYFKIDELPFPLACNNDQLEEAIVNFDENNYREELECMFRKVGLKETGRASETVAKFIIDCCEGDK